MSDPGKPPPPRFPYAAAVFCAACVGVATWLFFRWSYAWEVTPEELDEFGPRAGMAGPPSPGPDSRWLDGPLRELESWLAPEVISPLQHPSLGRYVRVRGEVDGPPEGPFPGWVVVLKDASGSAHCVVHVHDAAGGAPDGPRAFSGRVVIKCYREVVGSSYGYRTLLVLDTTRSRWTGESVAGIVVGAMGVVVFGMTFQHWLARRRASVGLGKEAGS